MNDGRWVLFSCLGFATLKVDEREIDMIANLATTRPSCRCYDCVWHPYSSHGIYAIGTYAPASRLSRRNGAMTSESVHYWYPFTATPDSGGQAFHVPVVESATGIRYINNV